MKVKISKLANNTGQIPQVPANPRQISKDDYQKLLKSLQEDPEFLEHKPLHVYPLEDKYIVLGGNQRLRALKELGYSEVPVTIYAADTPAKVLKARMIKDNSEYGKYDWDMLANEWPEEPLTDWGLNLPKDWDTSIEQTFENKEIDPEGLLDGDKTTTCPRCKFEFES